MGITSVARTVGGKAKNVRHRKRSNGAQLAGCFAIGDLYHAFPIDGKDRRERLTGQNTKTLGHGPRLIRKAHTILTHWYELRRLKLIIEIRPGTKHETQRETP